MKLFSTKKKNNSNKTFKNYLEIVYKNIMLIHTQLIRHYQIENTKIIC